MKRKLLCVVLIVSVFLQLECCFAVNASETAQWGTNYAYAKAEVTKYSGTCTTTYTGNGAVTINATYYYINPYDPAGSTIIFSSTGSDSNAGYYKSVSITRSCTTPYRTLRIEGTHTVTGDGNYWSVHTKKVYP